MDADVIVVGAGLAGLVATAELVEAGRKVLLVDQEGEQGIGGPAVWSVCRPCFVVSPPPPRLCSEGSVQPPPPDSSGAPPVHRRARPAPRDARAASCPRHRVKGDPGVVDRPAGRGSGGAGTHGAIARHYGVQGEVPDPHATTLDYLIAAAGG